LNEFDMVAAASGWNAERLVARLRNVSLDLPPAPMAVRTLVLLTRRPDFVPERLDINLEAWYNRAWVRLRG
jgi:hypothetical protein